MTDITLTLPAGFAAEVAKHVAVELRGQQPAHDGYLNTEQAAAYIAAKPRRIYELSESGRWWP